MGINSEHNVLRELRNKLNIIKTIHLAAEHHIELARQLSHFKAFGSCSLVDVQNNIVTESAL